MLKFSQWLETRGDYNPTGLPYWAAKRSPTTPEVKPPIPSAPVPGANRRDRERLQQARDVGLTPGQQRDLEVSANARKIAAEKAANLENSVSQHNAAEKAAVEMALDGKTKDEVKVAMGLKTIGGIFRIAKNVKSQIDLLVQNGMTPEMAREYVLGTRYK